MNVLFIPKKISILGRDWKIRLNDGYIIHHGKNCNGLACPKSKTITVNKKHKYMLSTMTHEIAHAFIFESSLMINTEHNTDMLGLLLEDVLNGITIIDQKKLSKHHLRKVKPKRKTNQRGSKNGNSKKT